MVVKTPATMAARPTNRAIISGRGRIFSAAMMMATPIITNGFIMPSTVRISIGAAQQRQQAAPCLQPMPKLASRSGHGVPQPNGERQRSRLVNFQPVN